MISLAAGALLGAAGAHLLPEAIEQLGSNPHLPALLLTGFVAFFFLEKTLSLVCDRWPGLFGHHEHGVPHDGMPEQANPALPTNLLFGGAIHSLVDGTAIAIAYSASVSAGIATTLAVLLHEVPHHLGDVGVLVYSGIPARKAVLLKFIATSAAIPGALIVLLPAPQGHIIAMHLLPLTAASFIYIALANLMPELRREHNLVRSAGQMAVFLGGVLLLVALNWMNRG
jgi:zinc and cadmium transporter